MGTKHESQHPQYILNRGPKNKKNFLLLSGLKFHATGAGPFNVPEIWYCAQISQKVVNEAFFAP
jgi:hypothetical protein